MAWSKIFPFLNSSSTSSIKRQKRSYQNCGFRRDWQDHVLGPDDQGQPPPQVFGGRLQQKCAEARFGHFSEVKHPMSYRPQHRLLGCGLQI